MATTTVDQEVIDGTPKLLAENAVSAVLQLKSDGPLLIYVGPASPTGDHGGVMLTVKDFPAISFFDLDPAVDKVYGVAIDGGDETVAVIASTGA